jgi:uncharacterized protein YjbI with pentapeptide repeats
MTIQMSCRLSLFCILILLGIAPAANAGNPKDIETLMTTNKCVGCDLNGVDLRGKKLVNADLQAANLAGADLTGTNLTNANLDGANLIDATLTNANFTGAKLQAASLVNVSFDRTNLTGADLSYGNLVNTNFKSAVLNKTDLSSANLALADFTGVNLSSVNFVNANLVGAKGINGSSSDRRNAPNQNPATPNVNESSRTIMNRPRPYRIPIGLGSPQRLRPGGSR